MPWFCQELLSRFFFISFGGAETSLFSEIDFSLDLRMILRNLVTIWWRFGRVKLLFTICLVTDSTRFD